MNQLIVEPGFVQVSRRCAIKRNDPPNHLLWDVLYDAKLLGRVSVHGGQVNLGSGKLPNGLTCAQIKTRLIEAGHVLLPVFETKSPKAGEHNEVRIKGK